MNVRKVTEIALLTAFITVTGAVKIPGLVPGTEFQLSAPLAVAICAVFGFGKYIAAGMLSSIIGLALGTQNLLNVFIALIFRLTVGAVLGIFGTSAWTVAVAGPLGSIAARLSLSVFVDKGALALVAAALPGMVYTALAAWPLTLILKKVRHQSERMMQHAVQR